MSRIVAESKPCSRNSRRAASRMRRPVSSALGVVLGGGIFLNVFKNRIDEPPRRVKRFFERVQKRETDSQLEAAGAGSVGRGGASYTFLRKPVAEVSRSPPKAESRSP